MSVRELLLRTDSRELSEWIAYASVEPFGEERADLRAGIIASTVYNCLAGKGSPSRKVSDFMPDFSGEQAAKQSSEEMAAAMRAFTVAMGGTVADGNNRDNRPADRSSG